MDANDTPVKVVQAEVVPPGQLTSHYYAACKECAAVPDQEYIYTWHSTVQQRQACRITLWDKLTHQGLFFWLMVHLAIGGVASLMTWSPGPVYWAPLYALATATFFRFLRRNLEDKILNLGKFTMPGWAGHATFYLFHCPECDGLAADYVHGYNARLDCGCGGRFYLRSPRFYTDDGREAPLRGLARWRESYRIAKEMVELEDEMRKQLRDGETPKE